MSLSQEALVAAWDMQSLWQTERLCEKDMAGVRSRYEADVGDEQMLSYPPISTAAALALATAAAAVEE